MANKKLDYKKNINIYLRLKQDLNIAVDKFLR
jgi:hypothetical protein